VSPQRAAFRQAVSAREPSPVCSVAEAAHLLGMSEMTLYRAISAGEFPAVRIRNRIIVPRAAIEAMLDAAISSGAVVEASSFVRPSPSAGGAA
jgi:excisionase family DNA binding protein